MLKYAAVALTLLGGCAECWATPPDAVEWVTPDVEAPGLQHRTFHSAAAGTEVSYFILTPELPDAEDGAPLPVLYYLHGHKGGLKAFPILARHFGDAMRSGKMPPAFVVFPNGMYESMWCDSKDGLVPMETVIIDELIPHIDATFPTIATREGRMIEGFSMGGYGAARLGFKHHDMFATVSILAGGPLQPVLDENAPRVMAATRERVMENVYGGEMEYFRELSPWQLAEQHAAALADGTNIRLVVGDEDGMLANTRLFDAHLTELGIPHTFTVLPGMGHTPRAFLEALAEGSWRFYRAAFGPTL